VRRGGAHQCVPPQPARATGYRVLVGDISHDVGETLIPTLVTRGAGAIKVYAYGVGSDIPIVAAELAHKLSALHGVAQPLTASNI
jgi:hypothetical protein